ncbi:hypothetical protein [Pseudoclavibacter sp. 13-3]|uniref:hypothetical protein n=1 Tax=Pseudoclavibacter sp. 13-3 TaxID=2901228 RepID=UPI001E604FD5|nr:hypothetical protein [Pseudoclavibacter sp. 13-3]MCD7102377.1 hypothetical protein [Pseudoclavibacter sp. 13-3]
MVLQRLMARLQPVLTVLLPLWLFFVGGFRAQSGWQVLALGIGAPVLFVALIVLALLIFLRPGRTPRLFDWVDVVVVLVVDVLVIVASMLGDLAWLSFLGLAVAAVGAIALSGWRLVQAGRQSVRHMHEQFQPRTEISAETIDGGEYTVIEVEESGPDANDRVDESDRSGDSRA